MKIGWMSREIEWALGSSQPAVVFDRGLRKGFGEHEAPDCRRQTQAGSIAPGPLVQKL